MHDPFPICCDTNSIDNQLKTGSGTEWDPGSFDGYIGPVTLLVYRSDERENEPRALQF